MDAFFNYHVTFGGELGVTNRSFASKQGQLVSINGTLSGLEGILSKKGGRVGGGVVSPRHGQQSTLTTRPRKKDTTTSNQKN